MFDLFPSSSLTSSKRGPNEDHDLDADCVFCRKPSAAELTERERRALEGDPAAAQEVAHERLYFPDQEFWAVVAAENGNGKSQYNYGVQLFGRWKRLKDPRDLFRAKYWFERADETAFGDLQPLVREELERVRSEIRKLKR